MFTTNEKKVVTKNGNGFFSFAKGMFVGSAMAAVIASFFATRNKTRGNDIPQKDGRTDRPYTQNIATPGEKPAIIEKGVKHRVGWRVMFYVSSAVAMFSDWKMKDK